MFPIRLQAEGEQLRIAIPLIHQYGREEDVGHTKLNYQETALNNF